MADFFALEHGQGIKSNDGWYRCIEILGIGGNSATFLAVATDGPTRGVPFAIKVFRKLSAPERRESFLAEASFLFGSSHPSIMRIFDRGLFESDFPFFVAEYLPLTLRDVMRRRPSLQQKLSYAMQLLSGLSYLDQLDPPVVHRDIKPENIFVKGPTCVIGDFGLIKKQNAELGDEADQADLKESLGIGMPRRYRSPDLVKYLLGQEKITTKSDVFQLGLVFAELFTGMNPSQPWTNPTDPVVLADLRKIPGSFGEEIVRRISRMLSFNPATRPSAIQMIASFDPLYKEVCERVYPFENSVFGKGLY